MTNRTRRSRRDFLKQTTTWTAAGALLPSLGAAGSGTASSSFDRLRIGCVGMGSMGMGDAREHADFGDILAVCDVDSRRVDAAKAHEVVGKCKPEGYGDYRRVLDRSDIEVISVVTPDHWHVKIAIEALEAGKHVFCQKPLTLTLEENQLIRAACRKHPDKVFFIGTQQRSDRDLFLRAINMVHKGLLGDIQKITVGIDGAPAGGPFPKVAAPPELDWNMWLGQAPLVDYVERRCHYEFRWWYEYSGGKFTDWGAHHVDIATWAIRQDQPGCGPVEIDGTDAKHPVPMKDGYPTVDDSYNTCVDYDVVCKFANGIEMHITSRGDNGVLFEGSQGRLFVNRGKISGKPIEENWDAGKYEQPDVEALYKGKPHEGHKANFYRCIAEGGLPVSDVFSHVQAMNTCHLAAIAARLGRKIRWDPQSEKIVGDAQAAAFVSRARRIGFDIPKV
jgi:predicted dehydrogenase